MNRKSILFLVMASAVVGQTKSPDGLKVWFADGTGLLIHTESTGPNLPISTSGVETVPAGYDFHRLVLDQQGKILLGYDIEARRNNNDTFAVRIKPVDTDKFKVGGKGKWLEIPTLDRIRAFPPLRVGDAVEIDILHHRETGERIYDVLAILPGQPSSRGAPGTAGERFSLENVRVTLNGRTIREHQVGRRTWMIGGAFMIYLPGLGQSYLALSPPSGFPFRPSGWVDHNILRFHVGADLIEIVGESNVLQKSDYATIWVYHDPGREPRPAEGRGVEFTVGDDAESLIRMNRQKGN